MKVGSLFKNRAIPIGILIGIQAILILLGIFFLMRLPYLYWILRLLSLIAVFFLFSSSDHPNYKLSWMFFFFLFPVFTAFCYCLAGKKNTPRKIKGYLNNSSQKFQEEEKDENLFVLNLLKQISPDASRQASYFNNRAFAPIFAFTQTQFLATGEDFFPVLLQELSGAKQFILMEYFIIERGNMWNAIEAILVKKAAQGVTVKLLFDAMGTVGTLPKSFSEELSSKGIETRVFNPFTPSLDSFVNYRDHRKICVVDGKSGFTGGINLADEYINKRIKHGHWKDSAIFLKGDAVRSLTALFFQLWDSFSPYPAQHDDFFFPVYRCRKDGYVQPFGDSPMDEEPIGETGYRNIINAARNYVYITTPYLILNNEMASCLITAAQSGVEVKIITPHIGDKKLVHAATRCHYAPLIRAGVKIYEYTPGFIHSKTIVADSKFGIVGTCNFDFRSFYLHFECGIFLYQSSSLLDLQKDFEKTLLECQEIPLASYEPQSIWGKIFQSLLKIIAPLL